MRFTAFAAAAAAAVIFAVVVNAIAFCYIFHSHSIACSHAADSWFRDVSSQIIWILSM